MRFASSVCTLLTETQRKRIRRRFAQSDQRLKAAYEELYASWDDRLPTHLHDGRVPRLANLTQIEGDD